MDWGALLIVLALTLLAGLYVALPILQKEGVAVTETDQRRSVLLTRREQILDILSELDADFKMHKISEAHYQAQRQALLQEAAAVLRDLDALKPPPRMPRRKTPPPQRLRPTPADDEIEALLAARRRQRQGKAAGFCPQCGAPVLASDRFCPRCGTPLQSS